MTHHQRMIDILAGLQGRFFGQLNLSSIGAGEQGCPGFESVDPKASSG